MNAVIRAELLRLRTIRAPFVALLVVLGVTATNAIPIGNAQVSSPGEVTDNLRGLLQIAALFASGCAAMSVGAAFQRGEVAVTYTAHPRRATVAAAHCVVYGAVGAALATLSATLASAIVIPLAAARNVASGLNPFQLAGMIGATAVCGAVFGVIGTLLATAVRHATIAVGVAVGEQFAETFLGGAGGFGHAVAPYLPVHLVGSATGAAGPVPAPAAIGLLLVYCAGAAALVRRVALDRDLT